MLPDPTATARPVVGAPPPDPPMDDFALFELLEPEARKHGLPVDLLLRQVDQESRRRVRAVSPKGAQGLMQLMPTTAASYGVTDPFDPAQNVRAGTAHMAYLWKKHKGDQRAVLAEYNGGPAAVEALRKGRPWKETAGYLQAIVPEGGATPASAVGQPPPPVTTEAPPTDIAADFEAFQAEETPEAQGVTPPQLPTLPGSQPGTIPDPRQHEIGAAQRLGLELGSAFDPMDRSGRRNLAGAGGAIAATAGAGAVLGGPPGVVLGALIGAGGAALGGAAAEAGEQLVGEAPPSGSAIVQAGTEQGLYDVVGSALLWPVKALGKRLIASSVSKRAYEGLQKTREATIASLNQSLDRAKDVLRGVRETTTRALEDTRGLVREEIGSVIGRAKATATGQISRAQAQAAEGVAKAEQPYQALVGQPPPGAADVGRQAMAVARGPAQGVREELGRAVAEAAESGPPVDIRALKAEAQRIIEQEAQPASTAFPTGSGQVADAMTGTLRTPSGQALPISLASLSPEARAYLAAAEEQGKEATLRHPAMRVLTQILNAPDDTPFAAAHQFKRELDDALLGQWDKAEKKRIASTTQHLRGELSAALQSHAPYAKATAAYAEIVPLFTKGHGARLKRIARDQPEVLVGMIKPSNPTKTAMLRELLVDLGGDGGKEAWDNLRSRWTHDKVLAGGVARLEDRLAKLTPEFQEAFYGDDAGRQVLLNLKTIAAAYREAVESGTLAVEQTTKAATERAAASVKEARGVGASLLATSRRAGRMDVNQAREAVIAAQRAKTAAQAPTATERRFFESSLAPDKVVSPEFVGADVARGTSLGPQSIWGGISIARLILHGPKSADLLEWVAYSPTHTRLLVQALTSPLPDRALADVLRSTKLLERAGLGPVASHERGGQPTTPRAGTPPPAPTP